MIIKKFIFGLLILLFIPLVFSGNYGAGAYGVDNYNIGEVSVVPTSTPDSPSGGGGSSCSYDWECTNWFPSICPAFGIQERVCANKGDCTGTKGMPNQTQTCEYLGPSEPLFDIYLTLEDKYKEICSGNKIKANIKLENYAKVELLDAFMTYWIIDENNKLIAEYKDTRAVEKETSFNIELNIPESTIGGTYRIYAEITYSGDKTAVAGESFRVVSSEECKFFSIQRFNWRYLIYVVLGVLSVLLILLLIKLFKSKFKVIKKKGKLKTHREYKNKIKQNLKKIMSKTFLTVLFGFLLIGILLIGGNSMTGFVVGSASMVSTNWNLFGFIVIIGMLGLLFFVYRKKIVEKIEIKRMNKYPRDSIKGLIKKRVYSEDGNFIGKIDEVILGENKIDSLKIKLNKKKKLRMKGIIVKYKNVKCVGHIVVIDERVLEKLSI